MDWMMMYVMYICVCVQHFNGPILVKIARAYMKMSRLGEAREAVDQALDLHEG